MNHLERNPDFLKRFENAVDLPTKETPESFDFLTAGLYLLIIVGGAALLYKVFEPRVVVNHFHSPIAANPPITEKKTPEQVKTT